MGPLCEGKEVWLGSASFDERVGLNHTTGQVTHHIAPNIDSERDLILHGLRTTGWAARESFIENFHPQREGRNGGGDLWHTDGRLGIALLQAPASLKKIPAWPRAPS